MARSLHFRRLIRLLGPTPSGAPAGPPLDRRSLLAMFGGFAALNSLPACKRSSSPGRVVIVGGGMAGLHCAFRLLQAGIVADVYEASDRFGGRMFTGQGLFGEGQVCELGGELVDSNHLIMQNLCDEFGLTLDDRLEDPTLEAERWWVAGRAVSEEEVVAAWSAVAPDFAAEIEAADSDDSAYDRLDAETLAELLDRLCPPSAYPDLNTILRVAYRGEFGLEPEEQSGLNLIYLIDALEPDPFRIFGDSDERYHIHEGSEAVITALLAALRPDQLHLGVALVGAEDGPQAQTRLFLRTEAGEERTELADRVVFALPYTLLRTCELSGLSLSPLKRQIIEELGHGFNTKVMVGFPRRLWAEDHASSGTVTADLDFQQAWDSAIGQPGPGGILTLFSGGEEALAAGEGTAQDYANARLPMMDQVFPGVLAEAQAETAVRMHWPTAPHQLCSYTCYLPGQWAFWSLEGEPEGTLHFANESCSPEFQGYMEGSAEAGARAAAEILDSSGKALHPDHSRILAPLRALDQLAPLRVNGRPKPISRMRMRRRLLLA